MRYLVFIYCGLIIPPYLMLMSTCKMINKQKSTQKFYKENQILQRNSQEIPYISSSRVGLQSSGEQLLSNSFSNVTVCLCRRIPQN